jgi:hypothetical protein
MNGHSLPAGKQRVRSLARRGTNQKIMTLFQGDRRRQDGKNGKSDETTQVWYGTDV